MIRIYPGLLLLLFTVTAVHAQKKGQEKIDSLIVAAARTSQDTVKIQLYNVIAYNYENIDASKGKGWSEKALALSKKIGWKKGMVKSSLELGFIYGCLGDYYKAADCSTYGLKIAQEMGNDDLCMRSYEMMGLVMSWMADFTKALEYQQQCLKLAEKHKNMVFMGTSMGNIAGIYQSMNQHGKAIEYIEKVVKINEAQGDQERLAITLNDLGVSYVALKNYPKALECYFKSLKISEEYGKLFNLTRNLSGIACIYNEQGNYKKALEYSERSVKISEKIKDPKGMAYGYFDIGNIYLAMALDTISKYPEQKSYMNKKALLNIAIDYLRKANSLAQQLNIGDLQVGNGMNLSSAYKELGDYKQALEAFQAAKVIEDSSFSIEKQKQLANLEAKRENELKQKEIEVLTEKNKRQQVIIASNLGGVLLLGVIIVVVFISLRNKRRAHALLEKKNAIIQFDLEKAKEYILSLLPDRKTHADYSADWVFIPSSQLGGDAFGYSWIDPDHFAFYILDVCGHGVGPALHAVSVMNVLNSRSRISMDLKRPEEVVATLNDNFQFSVHNNLFFTMWYGVYDRTMAQLTYVNAGHPAPLMIDEQGNTLELVNENIPVGCVSGYSFKPEIIEVAKNSRILLFSDGVYEFENGGKENLMLKDFYTFLIDNQTVSLNVFHDRLKDHYQATAFPDDYSMVKIMFS